MIKNGKMLVSSVLRISAVALMAGKAYSAPAVSSVSGTATAGSTVVVSGSGFGTKAQSQPVLWDDFEAGVAGKLVQNSPAPIGNWDAGAGSDAVTYTASRAHSGKQAALADFMTGYNASLARNMSFTRLYMDFWVQASYVDRQSRNWKPWRFYGQTDSLQLDYVWLCNGQLMNRDQSSAGWSLGDWGGPSYSNNTWMHIQLVYQESSPGSANGTIRHFIDSQVAGLNSSSAVTQQAAAHFDQIRIGHYWAADAIDSCASNSGARVYVDDVYIDTSWARVELGNAPTYAASTHREIQVSSAWSDSSVSVKFNPGSFPAGTTAYLFVTDSSNNTSVGIPVKIGSSGSVVSAVPNPPTNLSAN